MNKKAFTLLELLVVVLIIGILAAIALPQYKYAVTKSQYSTMKDIVRSIVHSQQDYYLINNTYTYKFSDLIIDLPCEEGNINYRCNINSKISIYLYNNQSFASLNTRGTEYLYFAAFYNNHSQYCQATKHNISSSDFVYKFCQKETGKTTPWLTDNSSYAAFKYK